MWRRTIFISLLVFFLPVFARAASLSLTPATGSFAIGSTFEVSIILDTEGQSINAVATSLSFPPDMLQVVSPSAGQSVIGVWTSNPKFDNRLGKLEIQGGIPGGINAKNALITTVTFRVRSTGEAKVKFKDESKALLNDGLGTDVLDRTINGSYTLKLPPPAGPAVSSDTHPDQNTWYPSKTVSLSFQSPFTVEGYSYTLSEDPLTIPDNISEGTKNSIAYANIADGVHYFHIKALRAGIWGGVTHFAVKIDSTEPADFKIDIAPSYRTSSHQPIIQFSTTDALSGIDHYDLKIISLSLGNDNEEAGTLFIEAVSPYSPPFLELGSYDVIVRAYDNSGNHREVVQRLSITTPIFSFISKDGLKFGKYFIKWMWVWSLFGLLVLVLVYLAYRTAKWREKVHNMHASQKLPKNVLSDLEELQMYRQKYGKAAVILLLIFTALFGLKPVLAQNAHLAPPLITTTSENVSNEEIFYVGGKTDYGDEAVIIFIQNLSTGETFSYDTKSDKQGEWFYRHNSFLSPGQYLLWAQGKIGEELSPPSPQEKMVVNRTAVSFNGGKLSYETIYLFTTILFLVLITILIIFIAYHYYHGKKKYRKFIHEVKQAEESIRRGFAVLRRDIEAELAVIKKAQLSSEISAEEKEKEAQLLKDLSYVENRLGKEIWQIEQEKFI